jgi:hypothetical protein
MEAKKDALMVQAVFAFAQGCGGATLSDGACAWFHREYYPWIDKPKINAKAGGKSPQDVWGEEGAEFANHFHEIGRRAAAASGGGEVQEDTLQKEAQGVYSSLDCPWCPDRE